MEIYIKRYGQRFGPFSLAEVNRQIAAGSINPSEQAWHENAPGWKPLFTIAGVILPGAASATARPTSMATPIPPQAPHYAGFWIRAVALLLDCLILAFPLGLVWYYFWPDRNDPSSGNLFYATAAIAGLKIFYFAGLWASPMQATLGQKMCGLRVMRDQDNPVISFSVAVGRLVTMALSTLTLGVGYVMAAFTDRKRALHDMLAGTVVIKAG